MQCIYEGCNNNAEEGGLCKSCLRTMKLKKQGFSSEEIKKQYYNNYPEDKPVKGIKRKINGLTEEKIDKLLLIKGLHEVKGWSFRRISRLLGHSPSTITTLYNKALELRREGKLSKLSTSERGIQITYTDDIEKWQRINEEVKQGKALLSDYDDEFENV